MTTLLTDAELREALRDTTSLAYLTDAECRWTIAYLTFAAPGALSAAIAQVHHTRPAGFAAQQLAARTAEGLR